MKNLKALWIFPILIVLAIVGTLFAQTYDRQPPQGESQERFGPPQGESQERFGPPQGQGQERFGPPPPFVSMAISPDSKYLYIFYRERIYQYELPYLKLIKSAGVDSRR
jgi:hypothetical protein